MCVLCIQAGAATGTGGGGGPIDLRLQRDVLSYHPTVMTIMLGMNDGRYTNHKPADDDVYYADTSI